MHHELVQKGHTCRDCKGVYPKVQFSVNVNKHCNGKTYTNVKKICSGCYNKKYFTTRKYKKKLSRVEVVEKWTNELRGYFKGVSYEA